jgi:hypothetical protein
MLGRVKIFTTKDTTGTKVYSKQRYSFVYFVSVVVKKASNENR